MSLHSRRRVVDRLPSPRRRSVLENLESRTLLHGGVGFEAHVNFQPASSVVPAGYVADTGTVFADRGGGLAYGWNLSNASYTRERNSSLAPDQRYDTLNQMQRSGAGTVWEMAVPNGTYSVRIVAGDPGAYDSTYAIAAEGVTVVAGKPTSAVRFFDGTKTVTVADGRLSLTNAAGSANNKIAFIDVHQEDAAALPAVSVTASDPSAAEAGRDPATFVVTRQGDTAEALAVNFTVGGTATAGADYAGLGGSVLIPAGAASAVVTVTPVDDAAAEDGETVVVTLSPSPAYDVVAPAGATATIADDDVPTQPGFSAKVNFQPAASPVPSGYLADGGNVFASRGSGFVYGWNASNATYARDRNSSRSPDQRYDTLTQMRGTGNVWEISLPNGTYTVRIVAGDPSAYDSTYGIAAEGITVVSGRPSSSVRWFDGTKTVTVGDGRLTVTNAAGSSNNKIAFIDITGAGGTATPTVSVSASDAAASETAGNGGAFTVSRTGPTDAPLTVNLAVGGSATGGADYAALGTSVVIPAGASSVVVPVVPADDVLVEGSESVTLAVVSGSGYDVASPSSAAVTIADNDSPVGTTLSWREVTPATVGRSEAMGAVVNGKLYHFGGYVDTTYKPTTRADVYDPATNRWSPIAGLPFGVSHAGTAVVGDSVYFAGGYPATSTGQSFATVRVTRYDTTTNTYQTNLPSLPLSRGGGALVAVGRKLHFFGGSDSSRRDAAQHWTLDLDNLAGGWVAKAPLPVATNHVAGAVVGGKIYAVGGQQGQDAAAVHRADVQVYDPATDRWTARAPMPAAKSHITNSTIVRDGRIIVLGGMGTGERVLGTVNSYDPVTNTWSGLTSLPTGRMSGVADLLPDGRIVFATGGSGFRTNTWIGSFA